MTDDTKKPQDTIYQQFANDPDFEQLPNGKWRRKSKAATKEKDPSEWNGPKGEEPTRFGDWEKKGIICDF